MGIHESDFQYATLPRYLTTTRRFMQEKEYATPSAGSPISQAQQAIAAWLMLIANAAAK